MPLSTSSPSLIPPLSVSALRGSVPKAFSSASVRPSPSVSVSGSSGVLELDPQPPQPQLHPHHVDIRGIFPVSRGNVILLEVFPAKSSPDIVIRSPSTASGDMVHVYVPLVATTAVHEPPLFVVIFTSVPGSAVPEITQPVAVEVIVGRVGSTVSTVISSTGEASLSSPALSVSVNVIS